MKKQFISMSLAAVLAASSAASVFAVNDTPTVFVDNSKIFFDDQAPVILGEGTTLVPARGVFEAMGAKVEWAEDTRTVSVTSKDGNTIIKLVIDDPTMKVYDMSGLFGALMSGQDFKAPETPVTLEVAPQIINDRTMIPLRAVSEAMDATVEWDGDNYTIDISTGNAPSAEKLESMISLSLSADKLTVGADEEVAIYVNAKNLPENIFVSGVTSAIEYDSENFEFVKAELVNGDTVIDGALGAANAEFSKNILKAASITIDAEKAAKEDGSVMKLTFKSLTGNKGSFTLSNGYDTKLGYNTYITLDNTENKSSSLYEGNNLYIDTTAVVVNDDTTPEATVSPEATAAPAATTAPEASATPEATATPVATASPEATATPEA